MVETAGHKILIVEDEAIVALHEEENLKNMGYRVAGKASSGEEAIRKAEETRPDLVLMDIVLKGEMDGIETAGQIHARFNIPVIFVTAYGDEETLQRAKLTEPFGYILKPFKERDLHVAIGIALYKHEMESRLREMERWFAATLKSIGDAVVTTDTDARITFMNYAAEKISKWRREDALGKSITDVINIVGSEKQPLQKHDLEQIIKNGIIINLPRDYITFVTREGDEIPIGGCAAPIRDDRGNISGIVMVFSDFTERKKAEDALHAQFNQISTIFDAMNAMVYVADPEKREILYMNKFGTTLFGSDWKGKSYADLIEVSQATPCKFFAPERLAHDMESLPPEVYEYMNSATHRWYQCMDKAIPWTDGRLVRMEVAVDITELKEVEQIKDDMISAVSHEMRTPLTAMLGYTSLLLENVVDQTQLKEFLGIIHNEAERLNELINNFLDLQRMKAKGENYRFKPLALQPLLANTAALFDGITTIHRFLLEVPSDLPPVFSDEVHVNQMVANLLSNAVKYSPQGGEIVLGARKEADDTVILWVKDEGIGIAPEILDKIFDRFYQADSGDRRSSRGTGLGLALVKEIVEAFGGQIWVESEVGKGSTFYVSLPVAKETLEAETKNRHDPPPLLS
jgi:two-component system, OmpR family, phosphate regulon sensor histidine kinase PhoR